MVYDPSIVRITGVDTDWLLSPVSATTDPLPDSDGSLHVSMSRLSGVSGEGVLARFTLESLTRGTSLLTIQNLILRDSAGQPIGDINADTFFDGTVTGAELWFEMPDFNGDGIVNAADFGAILAAWQTTLGDPDYDCKADTNGDGTVNAADFGVILLFWQQPFP